MTDHLDDDPNCDAAYDGEQCELALGHTGDHMSHNDDWPATVRDASRQAAGQPAAECAMPGFIDCGCNHLSSCQHPTPIAEQPDPTTVDDPVPLRWGLGDVLHSDDDTRIVCLSGPDREPYWLELDQERAAALRDDLAGPDGLAAPTNHDTETGVRNVIEHILTIYYQDSSAPSAFARALLAQHDASILNGAAQAYTDEADELERAAQEALDPGMARDAKYLRGFAASLRRLAAGAES